MAVKGLNVWIVEVGDGFDEAANHVTEAVRPNRLFLLSFREVVDGFLDVFLEDVFVSRISPSYKGY